MLFEYLFYSSERVVYHALTHLSLSLDVQAEIRSFQSFVNKLFLLLPSAYPIWRGPSYLLVLSLLLVPYRLTPLLKVVIAGVAVSWTVYLTLTVHLSPEHVALKVMLSTLAMRVADICIRQVSHPPLYSKDQHDAVTRDESQDPTTPVHGRGSFLQKTIYSIYLIFDLQFDAFQQHYSVERPKHTKLDDIQYCFLWIIVSLMLRRLWLCTLTKALFILCIRYAIMIVELILTGRHGKYVLYRPFSAICLAQFWTRHWHTLFTHFFRSVLFEPIKRACGNGRFGAAVALCVVFMYSGMWHAVFMIPVVPFMQPDHTHSLSIKSGYWTTFTHLTALDGFIEAWRLRRGMQWNMTIMFLAFAIQGPLIIAEGVLFGRLKAHEPSIKRFLRRIYTWIAVLGVFTLTLSHLDFHEYPQQLPFLNWIL